MLRIESDYEVAVIGGGPAGISAAVAAARNGMRTVLIESRGYIGGEAATGLSILTFHDFNGKQVVAGIGQEIVDRLRENGGSAGHLPSHNTQVYTWTPNEPETFKFVAMEMLLEAGVRLLLHSMITDVVMDDGAVRGVVVSNKSGQTVFPCRITVDATGDGDVAALAGAPYEKGRAEDGLLQPGTLMFKLGNVDVDRAVQSISKGTWKGIAEGEKAGTWVRVLGSFGQWNDELDKLGLFPDRNHNVALFSYRKNEVILNTARLVGVDATSAESMTTAEIKGRRLVMALTEFLKKHVPGFESCYLSGTAPHVGIRETRRIRGEYELNASEVLEGRRFEDSVACGSYTIDIHNPVGKGVRLKAVNKEAGYYGIPYGCLVPLGVENLLVSGRCVSATHEALGSVRVMAICMATGQAAGTAAALCVKEQVRPRRLDPALLREILGGQGAVVE